VISSLFRDAGKIASIRSSRARQRRLRADGPALLAKCLKYPALARRQWDALKKMAESGFWLGDGLKPYFTLVLSTIDVCLATVADLRDRFEDAPDAASDISALQDATASLQALRTEVSGVWDMLSAPPEQRQLRTPDEIRAGRAKGEYMSIEDAMRQEGLDPSEIL
jgi:hypothetical protein